MIEGISAAGSRFASPSNQWTMRHAASGEVATHALSDIAG
jgi:hypothetical protein